ncbi:major facilitator superfamily transporter [Colletotrichum scovillei]|uniref:Major facilitator superfamily transporter n=1 Tax=Colletotrichum scovillei TaxID=1209932 RepID=A0A9P7R2Q3_9PEZI|nr:major facilitator superfamily transporter [Colletotrichum scovillei]KAF4774379.1 major facilitator superfamily transporter [Colletotrichum scovillei]KAG7048405.1 major facilitator superfamily transporter [Colletotrichum scovillei]KAG7065571.1 major facilitator superfamily transporter [Colletotrichum scovillei]KAG7068171.1 major facilitator superfamily transporter [Colletotrichum scovillei]
MERPSSETLESRAARPSIAKRISATAMGGLHLLTSDTELSQDRDHDEYISPTRTSVRGRSRSLSRSLSVASSRSSNSSIFFGRPNSLPSITESENDPHGTEFRDPFADQNSIEGHSAPREAQNPFDDNSSGDEGTAVQELEPEPPYHVFTKKQKWVVIVIIGAAGLFSGLSSNIYFPALDTIARDLNVSSQMVSLTITSYLIIQGISPLIWGSISDALGRRPIYIASFAVYIIANIGLSFSPNFTVLLLFRGLQAAGSASTVSIGNGVIQDISPPAERGAFISFYQAIRNFSIAVGPVLGGLLANFLGFRSIFVFLLILSSIVTLVIVFWLPETMRSIAGNGSLRLGGIYKPIIWYLGKEPEYLEDPDEPIPRKKVTLMTFVEPLRLLIQKDILINLVFGGVVYTIWTMVTSSTTILFKELFGLSDLQTGLAFLPNGLGTIVGSAIVGKLMTKDYLEMEEEYKTSHNIAGTEKLSGKNMPAEFPIERARLRRLPWIVLIFVASTGGYGLSLNFPSITSRSGWIAVPLVLQFFIAATSNAVFALNQTLVTDLCPGKGASATAINNLVRCGLGAIGVALVDNFVATTGPGAAFLGLALVTVAVGPLAVIHWYWGQTWRAARMREKTSNNEKA